MLTCASESVIGSITDPPGSIRSKCVWGGEGTVVVEGLAVLKGGGATCVPVAVGRSQPDMSCPMSTIDTQDAAP